MKQTDEVRLRHAIALSSVLVVVMFTAGCASPYLVDRGRDVADILTATVGGGLGAQARIGPIHVGMGIVGEGAGLRGGTFGVDGDMGLDFDGGLLPAPSPGGGDSGVFTASTFVTTNGLAAERGKLHMALSKLPFLTTMIYSVDPKELPQFQNRAIPGHANIAYFTQVEAVIAVVGGIRLGINPGELLDFLLGWIGVDLFADDIGVVQSYPSPKVYGRGPAGPGPAKGKAPRRVTSPDFTK